MLYPYTVTYCLTDEQQARLQKLTARYNAFLGGTGLTPEGLLQTLMISGTRFIVDLCMNEMDAGLDAAEQGRANA